jgi:hypothetical protein
MSTNARSLVRATFAVAVAALVVLPALASAASYAYVDAGGDVKSVMANDWQTAIATAPNIHIHSGVLLLDSPEDLAVVGDEI